MSPELNSEESLEASQVTGAVKNGCGWRLPYGNPLPAGKTLRRTLSDVQIAKAAPATELDPHH